MESPHVSPKAPNIIIAIREDEDNRVYIVDVMLHDNKIVPH
jgi:hypothetical protein